MLAKKFKIGSRPRIEYIFDKGNRVRSRFFYFRYLKNNSGFPRFSLTLSSKIARTATARNKLRRRIYECIRRYLKRLLPASPKTCYDVVVLCSERAARLTYGEIEKDLSDCLKKLFPQETP